ncbi:pilus assembly protein CpaB [Arthrobacter sp. MSA 4-2]|uniref:Flp pilus assembly protein CpaB n=1 Tax=Arthrobacter sp. MSA 4-2 TaxID=2794349 RepID=UPI0018E775BE|nr:RcpC/CpaB family pilus assembly protein [Arthrobacter sp. MSA 4-2]MBJ2120507.1 pilus assembly protein CpaB [Arthrobacter sp. MSA 4-2]
MKTRLLGGIAALLLGIIGTGLLVLYVQGAEARAQEGLKPVDVLVVVERIPAGTPAEEIGASVQRKSLAKSAVPETAVADIASQTGKVTAADLEPGEQVLSTKLVNPEQYSPGTVPVPDGLEEVTILLAPERILGARLQAGDEVAVYASFETEDEIPAEAPVPPELVGWKQSTKVLFHDVLITAVQQAAPDTESSAGDENVALPGGSAFITVARTDVDAAKLIFAAEYGSLWLSKESELSKNNNPPVTTLRKIWE